jgi:hypothetical protein
MAALTLGPPSLVQALVGTKKIFALQLLIGRWMPTTVISHRRY